jgi:hypothetical protein
MKRKVIRGIFRKWEFRTGLDYHGGISHLGVYLLVSEGFQGFRDLGTPFLSGLSTKTRFRLWREFKRECRRRIVKERNYVE